MITILGIETATARLSVALRTSEGHITERHTDRSSSHCELLTGFIRELVDEASLSIDDIDCIAVSKGPGSFTGLRIGIASAMGFAYGLGKPVCGIDTLMGLAWNTAVYGGLVCPIIDAKRSELYTALYRIECESPHIILESTTLHIKQLSEKLASYDETITVTGPAARCFSDILLSQTGTRIAFIPDNAAQATASSIVELGYMEYLKNGAIHPASLKPLYLRRSDAEISRSCRSNQN